MLFSNNAAVERLEHLLASITKGRPLQQWAEDVTFSSLEIANQQRPPVELGGELLRSRRIRRVKKLSRDIPERARVLPGKDGFVVEITERYLSNRYYAFWSRLLLAHEIAHTFFYDVSSSPPRQLIFLDSDNRDYEYLCDYLARALLMPTPWLQEQLRILPYPGSNKFSLGILEELKKIFKVPWQVISRRIITDLALWNCIILQFSMLNENNEREPKWHLKSHIIPPRIRKNLYIPMGHKRDSVRKLPSTKGLLTDFVGECFRAGQKNQFFQQNIDNKIMGTSTTGNLGKFLYEKIGTEQIKIYVSVYVTSQKDFFEMPNVKTKPFVLLCIPLEYQK